MSYNTANVVSYFTTVHRYRQLACYICWRMLHQRRSSCISIGSLVVLFLVSLSFRSIRDQQISAFFETSLHHYTLDLRFSLDIFFRAFATRSSLPVVVRVYSLSLLITYYNYIIIFSVRLYYNIINVNVQSNLVRRMRDDGVTRALYTYKIIYIFSVFDYN